jgi:hypothetical protein
MRSPLAALAAAATTGLAAVGGGFAVFGGYDDSPGGTLLGIAVVVGAMFVSWRSASRSARSDLDRSTG